MSSSSSRRSRLGALAACLLALSVVPPGAAVASGPPAAAAAVPPAVVSPPVEPAVPSPAALAALQPSVVATPTVRAVATGAIHTCVIREDGTVGCWGDDSSGESSPPDGTFTSIDAYDGTTCGVRTDGSLACWGNGFVTGNLLPTDTFRRVWVGPRQACALRDDDTLACWGQDDFGELGVPAGTWKAVGLGEGYICALRDTDSLLQCWGGDPDGPAVPVPTADTLLAVDGGCVTRTDHTWWCWDGVSAWYQRAAGQFMATSGACAIRVDGSLFCDEDDVEDTGINTPPAGTTWEGISEQNLHACAIDADDQLTCWGGDWYGQRTPRPTPTVFAEPWRTDTRAAVDWSARFALVPVASYDVRYQRFGWNDTKLPAWTRLYTGTTATGTTLTTTPGYTYCVSVRARDANGVTSAWSDQLEDRNEAGCTTTPLDDRALTRVKGFVAHIGPDDYRGTILRSVTAGDELRIHLETTSAALLATTCPTCGSVRVTFPGGGSETLSLVSPVTLHQRLLPLFGGPYTVTQNGTLRITVVGSGRPVLIDGLLASVTQRTPAWADSSDPPQPGSGETVRPVTLAVAGLGFTCALAGDGAHCWGRDDLGQATAPAGTFVALAPTMERVCAVGGTGAITCWGETYGGAPPAGTFVDVAVARGLVCGIGEDGAIACGDTDHGPAYAGQFVAIDGAGDTLCARRANGTLACFDTSQGPVASPEGSFLDVSMAEDHACGLLADGTLTCWGDDTAGQSSPPSGTFSAVAAGFRFSCAIRTGDAAIRCWGDDHYLQAEPPAGAYTGIAAGWRHACAVRAADDRLACWGQNRSGEVTPRPHAAMAALPETTLAARTAVGWSGDSLGGVTGYDTRYRRYTFGVGWGPWTAWHAGTLATAASIALPGGRRTCVQVRAHDGDGLVGPYSVPACTTAPFDDRVLGRSSGWTAISGTAYYRGTALRTTKLGARLVLHGVPDRAAAYLVATVCPGCGKVRITWTSPHGTTTNRWLNLAASVTRNQKVLEARFLPWPASSELGTLTITVVTSGKKVQIDGLLLLED